MNFHKTIGYLAALLLMVGFGVPDSFAQPTAKVSSITPARVTEGQSRTVTVEVTLSVAPGADKTVTVEPKVGTPVAGVTINPTYPDPDDPTDRSKDKTGFKPISISGTNTTGSATTTITVKDDKDYIHPRDKDVTIDLSVFGKDPDGKDYTQADGVTLTVREDDLPIGPLSLSADPPSLSVDGKGESTLTVSIDAAPGNDDKEVPIKVSVTATTVHSSDKGNGGNVTKGDIEGTAKSVELNLTNVKGEGSVTVTASAKNYTPATITLPIIARNADDVEGFRVTIVSPGDGAWVGIGNKKVKVQVRRLNTVAYPWTSFDNIAISLRDTAVDKNIYTLTASGFAVQDGNIVFSKTATSAGNFKDHHDISYSEADDAITFAFRLVKVTNATAESVLGKFLKDDHPRAGDTAKGQRMGVFARAVFTGSGTGKLNSNDVKKEVFNSPATLGTVPEADRVVGDGKLIKIDLVAPSNAAKDKLKASIGGELITAHTKAKIGDEIKVAVGVGAQTRFRDDGMQIEIVTVTTENAKGATLKSANFSQLDVIGVAGGSLRTSVTLTSGLIKAKAYADGTTRDGADIKKNALFEPDNMALLARARTKDQAGNWSVWEGAISEEFTGDTRAPGISVLNPADGGRFSGAHGDVDFEQFLKPLKLRVDEDIMSLSVYAAGAADSIDLWTDASQDLDLSTVVTTSGVNTVGDTIAYDTRGLKWKNAKGELKPTGQGGTKIDLVIVATDLVGNETKMTLLGVFHDEKAPIITDFFPKRELLEDDNYQINDATRHPVFTLNEAVDSLAITYDPSSGTDIVHVVAAGLAKGEHQEIITDPFVHDKTYSLTIFARDLAGNAYETPANAASGLKFNENFDNPIANAYTITAAEGDSVVAGQLNDLVIQALDKNDNTKRNALTHKGAARISAWDMATGGIASSVRFSGGGVTDNGDGSAMLDAATWKLGKREVQVGSNKAIDLTKILVQNLTAGEAGTSVATFEGAIDSFYVGAADFVGFEITAYEPNVDTGKSVSDISGNFDLKVVPVDRYGNPSVRAYEGATGKLVGGDEDSLAVLDHMVKDNAIEYKNGIDVTFASIPALEELNPLFVFPIEKGGQVFPILLPAGRRSLTVQVRVDNDNLHENDERSMDVRTTKIFNVVSALSPVLAADMTGDIAVPATVTVTATGFNANSTVTFTVGGEAQEKTADADGSASVEVAGTEAGTVTVSASDGRWDTDDLSITFVEAPAGRQSYADADGNPVYLIAKSSGTVGVDDFLALIAAFGSSDGDANYSLQADVNDDGTVDVDDFLAFIGSFGRTAVGPSTKPLVLLPGINENAEFALSLGSERVVAGELVAVDVSLANVAAVMGYGFTLNYDVDKFEFISAVPADEDLLKSTGGETPLFHHLVADGQVEVVNGVVNGTAVSGGGDIVRFVFRVLYEFEDNARFEIADGVVFDPSQLSNPAVIAGVLELQSTPREFALHQNFPNPFNPDTTIKYELAESADVTLQIYNVLGQVVRTLVASEAQNAGRYQIRWNGMDDRGVSVSSGVYFYRISAEGKFQNVRKLMLLK